MIPLKYQKRKTEEEVLCDYFDCKIYDRNFHIDEPKFQTEKKKFNKKIKQSFSLREFDEEKEQENFKTNNNGKRNDTVD